MEDLKIVMKCENTIIADEVKMALEEAGIPCMAVDETITGAVGGYGPNPAIAIKVYKKDLEKAKEIVSQIQEERENVIKIWCPRCGSEDVEPIEGGMKKSTYWKRVAILLLTLTLVWGFFYQITPILTICLIVIITVLGLIYLPKNQHYFHCKQCGKKF